VVGGITGVAGRGAAGDEAGGRDVDDEEGAAVGRGEEETAAAGEGEEEAAAEEEGEAEVGADSIPDTVSGIKNTCPTSLNIACVRRSPSFRTTLMISNTTPGSKSTSFSCG
jgi:hypothetical protein